MVNWNNPTVTSLYNDVLTELKERDINSAKMDFAGDTNLPVGAKRSNASDSDKLEKWSGSAWSKLTFHTTYDDHIADVEKHRKWDSGDIKMTAYPTPPSGWLLCDGSAISRTTYAALFAALGTFYGVGDGSTTFNIPDYRGRSPIGVNTGIAALNAAGKVAGSWDHTHSVPNHTHTIPNHAHTMKNHTHSVGAHAHSINDHTHTVPGHGHHVKNSGGDIRINSSGAHVHNIPRRANGGSTSVTARVAMPASSGSEDNGGETTNNSGSLHSHNTSDFDGWVGTPSKNGDTGFATTGTALNSTNNSTAFNSGAPSDNETDGAGILTTNSTGASTTGVANHPVQTCYFFIKT